MPNAENIGKLTAALRSGEFPQDTGLLRTPEGWCCLGVACEVYRRETGQGRWEECSVGFKFVLDSGDSRVELLRAVADWYGFRDCSVSNPILYREAPGESGRSAAGINDSGQYSFEVIADLFDKLAGQQ